MDNGKWTMRGGFIARPAMIADIPAILAIFDDAKAALKAMGVDQWQYGYPNRAIAEEDIAEGAAYVLETDGKIAAYIAVRFGIEPEYDALFDGAWKTDTQDYATVHRVAVSKDYKGQGLSKELLRAAEDLARQRGVISMRSDTHSGNNIMQSLLVGQGYVQCGKCRIAGGPEAGRVRLCYEKTL